VRLHFTDWNDPENRSLLLLEIRSENAFPLGNSTINAFRANFTCWNAGMCPVYDYERKGNGT
jgi:hypothetical protein